MDWSVDKVSEECAKYSECTKKCGYYDRCIHTFKKNNLNPEENNPATLNSEINGFEVYRNTNNRQENFNVNICEVPNELVNKAIISLFYFKEDTEIKNIIRSSLNKFYTREQNKNEIIIKLKDNQYHFIFNCLDCNATNDFTDYANGNETFFYCRYCGKKHKFNLTKAEERNKNNGQ